MEKAYDNRNYLQITKFSNFLFIFFQGENSAYYRARVAESFETEVLLRFEDDWQPASKFPFARVRLPPQTPQPPLPQR